MAGAAINQTALGLSATTLTVICVGIATITDLRRRRVPNLLTFPTVAAGLGLWTAVLGWKGLALSACGTVAAPLVLALLHLGRGPGMGDIKLAAGVGALLGPESVAMPEISRFFGIVVRMHFDDHAPPHFHARYGDFEAVIEIESLAILRGKLPARVRGLVTEWAAMHVDELLKDWELARNGAPVNRIEPLR